MYLKLKMGNTPSTSAVRAMDLKTSTDTRPIWRYKVPISGRGARTGEYTYTYVDSVNRIVINPGQLHPIRAYEADEWDEVSNEKELVPVRISLLHAMREYLEYHNTITNEIQRQLAVN